MDAHIKGHDWHEVFDKVEMINNLDNQGRALERKQNPWGVDSALSSIADEQEEATKEVIASYSAIGNDLTEDIRATVEAFKIELGHMNTKLTLTIHAVENQPTASTGVEYRQLKVPKCLNTSIWRCDICKRAQELST